MIFPCVGLSVSGVVYVVARDLHFTRRTCSWVKSATTMRPAIVRYGREASVGRLLVPRRRSEKWL